MKKRILSWLLTLTMIISMVPAAVFSASAANASDSVDLGNAVYVDAADTTQGFTYPHATVISTENIGAVTISINNGSMTNVDLTENEGLSLTDNSNQTVTWVFKTSQTANQIAQRLQKVIFKCEAGTEVAVLADTNETKGFDSLNNSAKLKYDTATQHYYLWVPFTGAWDEAANASKGYKLMGYQGYLATITQKAEWQFINAISPVSAVWLGGTTYKHKNGDKFNLNNASEYVDRTLLDYVAGVTAGMGRSVIPYYYWINGPEQGQALTEDPCAPNEPNATPNAQIHDGFESCLMIIPNEGINDIFIDNSYSSTDQRLYIRGYCVEFGGYVEGNDPGGRDERKSVSTEVTQNTIYKKEARIGDSGLEYGTVIDTVALANGGETVNMLTNTPTACAGELKQNVILKKVDGTTYVSRDANAEISIVADATVTLTNGEVDVAHETEGMGRKLTVGGYEITSDKDFHASAEANGGDLGQVPSIKATEAAQVFTVTKGGKTYTYTAKENEDVFYLGEYDVNLNNDDRVRISTLALTAGKATLAMADNRKPYHQLENYKVTITPDENYSLDNDKIGVKMGQTVLQANQFTVADVQASNAKNVTLNVPVIGNLTYYVGDIVDDDGGNRNPVLTRDMTDIVVNIAGNGTYTATYQDDNGNPQVIDVVDGKVTVPTKTEVALTFKPNDTTANGESFSILTALAEGNVSKFDDVTLDWDSKSYTYTFTPQTMETVNLTAAFTRSHLVHINVSEGRVDTDSLDAYVKNANDTDIVVADNAQLNLKFASDSMNPTFHTYSWSANGADVKTGTLKEDGDKYTWNDVDKITVTAPGTLKVSFDNDKDINAQVSKIGGELVKDDQIWEDEADVDGHNAYKSTVPSTTVKYPVKVRATEGYALEYVTVDSTKTKAAVLLEQGGALTYDAQTKIYNTYTVEVDDQPHTLVFDFAKLVNVTFKAGNDKLGTETVLPGAKLKQSVYNVYKSDQKVGQNAQADDWSFLAWKDNNGKVYNGNVEITNDVTLSATYAKNANAGDNGTVIGANDFEISLSDVQSLTDAIAKLVQLPRLTMRTAQLLELRLIAPICRQLRTRRTLKHLH